MCGQHYATQSQKLKVYSSEEQGRGHRPSPLSRPYAEWSILRTKEMPLRRATKPIMTGSTVGSRPTISSSTPLIISPVTMVDRVVAAEEVV